MAGHLTQSNATVMVWNRTPGKAEAHAKQFGSLAVEREQLVQADFIFSCLPTSAEVEAVIAAYPPRSGSVWIDCTSGVPASAQKLSRHIKQHAVDFLDAPVSGQTIGAETGTLTVMVGGERTPLSEHNPLFRLLLG